jgi:DNA-directed RNA polymerase specialized sigma24 family protein
MVLGVCGRVLSNCDDADDAFQATFLVLVRKAALLKRTELLGRWLYGVAYRRALKVRTTNARRRVREREMSRPEQTPEMVLQELLSILDWELNGLPEHHRIPVVLCDRRNCSVGPSEDSQRARSSRRYIDCWWFALKRVLRPSWQR